MSVLIDVIEALCLRLLSTSINLMQSVAFTMNSCQQFEGYQSAGDTKPEYIK